MRSSTYVLFLIIIIIIRNRFQFLTLFFLVLYCFQSFKSLVGKMTITFFNNEGKI